MVVFEKRHLSLLLMPTTRDVSRGEMAVSAGYYNGHEKVSFSVRFCWRLRCQIVRFLVAKLKGIFAGKAKLANAHWLVPILLAALQPGNNKKRFDWSSAKLGSVSSLNWLSRCARGTCGRSVRDSWVLGWVLVFPGFEPAASRSTDRGLSNWANRYAAFSSFKTSLSLPWSTLVNTLLNMKVFFVIMAASVTI